MSYRSDIPFETNAVRGVSGDLALIQGNFKTLEPPVQSGLNAFISGGANVAGALDVARSNAANALWDSRKLSILSGDILGITTGVNVSGVALWTGSGWDNGAFTISGVNKMKGTGATDGQAMVYNAASDIWQPGTVSGGGSGGTAQPPGEYLCQVTFASSQQQTVLNSTLTTVTGLTTVARNVGGFTVNSGFITVPTGSGYTHARVAAFLLYQTASGSAPGSGVRQVVVAVSGGSQTQGGHDDATTAFYAGTAIAQLGNTVAAIVTANTNTQLNFASPLLPISGGETYKLQTSQTQGVQLELLGGSTQAGAGVWFQVQCFKLTSGGVG